MRNVSSSCSGPATPRTAWAVALLLAATPLAGQEPAEPTSPQACVALVADAERLACYDRAFGREAAAGEVEPPTAPPAADPREVGAAKSLLDSRWELFPESKLGTFGLRGYRPVYVLPWVGSRRTNQFPSSPAPDHSVESSEDLDSSEVAFQISFKTKVWQGVFGDTGDLWLAYTQSSRWQLYNSARSRPFRETNYEPELLLAFTTHYRLLGWEGRLFTVGLNHESNGRDQPRSRSWNRVTASIGLEREGWTLTLRPWWRIPESAEDDDNPDIADYLGRADVLLVRHVRNHEITALARHSLRGGDRSRGALQLDWAFPIRGNLRGHVQLFHGYGESLIDYNFRTTRLGLGISLIEWY
ncbi:MAG TPA: phospholipase A [Thermoanaerobaculia bacterium]|nr:phospholipase A [Thermoanaerobaculia bacterium]